MKNERRWTKRSRNNELWRVTEQTKKKKKKKTEKEKEKKAEKV
jgi:hypothetical protein